MTDRSDGTSHFVSAPDGLRLHWREFGPDLETSPLPVVCLPGLARTAADFDVLARVLVAEAPAPGRRVLALDYRGRGLSDRDPDPGHYDLKIESGDVLAVLDAAGVTEAVFVGTSRGGLISMILGALRPTILRGVVLNDIGPVLEPRGILRIRGYVGKLPRPTSWNEAVEILKSFGGSQFTGLSEADWRHYAELTFAESEGNFAVRYDPALLETLKSLDVENLPILWPQFEGLGHVPLLVVRGANSDLLSAATAAEMLTRHPDAALHVVPGQGHAPLLTDPPTTARIAAFVTHCDIRDRLSRRDGGAG